MVYRKYTDGIQRYPVVIQKISRTPPLYMFKLVFEICIHTTCLKYT
jgi:hypothetical protein